MEQLSLETALPVPPQQQAAKGLPPALWALCISAFAIGTTEFVAVGIQPIISGKLQVSISSAGAIMSMYALGVAFGGPLLSALTSRVPRKSLLLAMMVLFIMGHIASALAPTFGWLLVFRFLSGFAHATYFGVGANIAAAVVAPDKKATAIAIMFSGLTVAIIVGVPLGTFIGRHFGWRATFAGVAVLGVISFIANWLLLPAHLSTGAPLRLRDQLRVLKTGPVMLALAITALGYGGTFVTFTYLATLLEKVTQFSAGAVNWLLLLYGVAVALGNLVGGRLSNTNPARALIRILLVQTGLLFLFTFTMYAKVPAVINLFLVGAGSLANGPGLQLYVVQLTQRYLPGAEDIASSLNIAAFNIGVALGALVGGLTVDYAPPGLTATPWIAALIVFMGAMLTMISYRRHRAVR
ncbi:MAG TPA: MFS transporter [Chitinophaga sp.]